MKYLLLALCWCRHCRMILLAYFAVFASTVRKENHILYFMTGGCKLNNFTTQFSHMWLSVIKKKKKHVIPRIQTWFIESFLYKQEAASVWGGKCQISIKLNFPNILGLIKYVPTYVLFHRMCNLAENVAFKKKCHFFQKIYLHSKLYPNFDCGERMCFLLSDEELAVLLLLIHQL